ncbi:hypothetical protein SVIO_096410 [Streptomyces violaceusniger]|uniref:Uncharacterized protein n=1 Tax=Streptomyces violaceusniger TaxID=68280 RepID=A0A4D4LKQ6_STRVO|nr:hypothetical protein SVIO_096410 [Streptomyces violaceusniger]
MSPLLSLSALRLPLPPSLLLAPLKSGVTAGVRDAAGAVGRLVRPSERGIWSYPGRYYIEVRGVHGIGGEQVARRVELALEEHSRVQWARVNAPSERVVVAVGKPPPSEQDLIARIERAELQAPVGPTEEFDEWAPEPRHPSGGAREAQSLVVVAADVVGLSVATALRLTPWLKLPTEVAATMSVIQNHPRLRRLALAITRGRTTEPTLPVLSALTQGVATSGGGSCSTSSSGWPCGGRRRRRAGPGRRWSRIWCTAPGTWWPSPSWSSGPARPPRTPWSASRSSPWPRGPRPARSPPPSPVRAAGSPSGSPPCPRRPGPAGRDSRPASAGSWRCAASWPWTAARCGGWARSTPWCWTRRRCAATATNPSTWNSSAAPTPSGPPTGSSTSSTPMSPWRPAARADGCSAPWTRWS